MLDNQQDVLLSCTAVIDTEFSAFITTTISSYAPSSYDIDSLLSDAVTTKTITYKLNANAIHSAPYNNNNNNVGNNYYYYPM